MFFICVLLFACLLNLSSCAWYVQVDSHEEDCYSEFVKNNVNIGFSFQVVEGGFLDIDIRIKGPDGHEIYYGSRESNGKYAFKAYMDGKYQVCFSNKMSSVTPKRLMFDLLVGPVVDSSATNVSNGDKTPQENVMQVMVHELKEKLKGVRYEQDYMMARTNMHRRTSEHTNTILVRWTLFELTLALIGVFFQIWYIKTFFEIRRIV